MTTITSNHTVIGNTPHEEDAATKTKEPPHAVTVHDRLAMARAGIVTVGPGAMLDLALALSVTATATGAFTRPTHSRTARTLRRLCGITAAAAWAWPLLLRPWYLQWGATDDEAAMPLPGDELVPCPRVQSTRAVTIHAPAEAVWPWLVQFGKGAERGDHSGGYYSYDHLENLAGLGVRSPELIVPEYQHREAGEFIAGVPARVASGFGWQVAEVVPGRALVLRNWGAFVLVPMDDHTTRLIVRSRSGGSRWSALVSALLWEVAHFLMERRMLLTIKQRAGRTHG
jgi:hypothetical protein